MPEWRIKYDGVENLTLAVMGCIVNGPGESKHADIGISLPGTGEAPAAPVFIDGKKSVTLRGENIAQDFVGIVEEYVARKLRAQQLNATRATEPLSFVVAIPARYASTRLPGKPLLPIAGTPMVLHVVRRALDAGAERVIVATDDSRVADALKGSGAHVVMTRADHVSGSDRLAECAEQLNWSDDTIVVNLQGDEPLAPGQWHSCRRQRTGGKRRANGDTGDADYGRCGIAQSALCKSGARSGWRRIVFRPRAPTVAARCVFRIARSPADRHGIFTAHWYLCVPRRVPAPLRRAGTNAAGTCRVAGAVARSGTWLSHRGVPGAGTVSQRRGYCGRLSASATAVGALIDAWAALRRVSDALAANPGFMHAQVGVQHHKIRCITGRNPPVSVADAKKIGGIGRGHACGFG